MPVMFLLQNVPNPEDEVILPLWLLQVLLYIVGLAFAIKIFQLFEYGYANWFERPLYRNLFPFKKLKKEQLKFIENRFYKKLSPRHKQIFEHRVAHFIDTIEIIGMDGFQITDEVKLKLAVPACMLMFGRKHHRYILIERIEIYPNNFYEEITKEMLKGAFLPMKKTLAVSWHAIENPDENPRNILFHEFMHALHWESNLTKNFDSERFQKYYKKILEVIYQPEKKRDLEALVRPYALTNQYEFMAEMTEYFFEAPQLLMERLPEIAKNFEKLLNIKLEDV